MALTSTPHVCADRLGLLAAVLCAAAARAGFADVESEMAELVTYVYDSSAASEDTIARADDLGL